MWSLIDLSNPKAPLNDPKACASFMGLKPSTTKSHLVRAILESVAFRWVSPKGSLILLVALCEGGFTSVHLCRNKQLYETMLRETHIPVTKIR